MSHRGLKLKANNFYKMKGPVKTFYNYRTKKWQVVDKKNVILAEDLTKEIAETFVQAVNYTAKTLTFLKMMLSYESVVGYVKDSSTDEINQREDLINEVYNYLLELKVIEPPPPKWEIAFKEWADNLMEPIRKQMDLGDLVG